MHRAISFVEMNAQSMAVLGHSASQTIPVTLIRTPFVFLLVVYTPVLLLALHSDQLYPVAICQFVIVDICGDIPLTLFAFILREYHFFSTFIEMGRYKNLQSRDATPIPESL